MAVDVGKTVVTVNESQRLMVNRILVALINEAIYTLMEGVATVEGIDIGMKLGANNPIGALGLADLIGMDIVFFCYGNYL